MIVLLVGYVVWIIQTTELPWNVGPVSQLLGMREDEEMSRYDDCVRLLIKNKTGNEDPVPRAESGVNNQNLLWEQDPNLVSRLSPYSNYMSSLITPSLVIPTIPEMRAWTNWLERSWQTEKLSTIVYHMVNPPLTKPWHNLWISSW